MVDSSAAGGVDQDLMLRMARAVVAEVDSRELVVFDRVARRSVPSRATSRHEPGEFGLPEVMDSLIGGALAASTAVLGTALVEASERTWRWFASRLRQRYAPPAADRPEDPDADLLRELDRIYRATYDATGPHLHNDADRNQVAQAAIVSYLRDRLAALDAHQS